MAKPDKRKKKQTITIKKNAGNVPYNVAQFNSIMGATSGGMAETFDESLDMQDWYIDKLVDNYLEKNKKDFIEGYLNSIEHDDEYYEMIEDEYDGDEKAYEQDIADTFYSWIYEDTEQIKQIEEEIIDDLNIKIDEAMSKVYADLRKVVEELNNEIFPYTLDIKYKHSRSWNPGNFISQYIILELLNENEDIVDEDEIRLSDGHINSNTRDVRVTYRDLLEDYNYAVKEIKGIIYDFVDMWSLRESFKETLEVHNTLNPIIWDEQGELRDSVKNKLLKIVDKFKEEVEEENVNIDIKDILLVGSNVNYNYTNTSDLDVHIIVNTDEKLLLEIYDAYRRLFNQNYNITLKGIEVELYVESIDSNSQSNGVYSLYKGWVKRPTKENIPNIHIEEEFKVWRDKLLTILKTAPTTENLQKFVDELYQLRKEGLLKDGEYSLGNQVFKEFRSLSILSQIKGIINLLETKQLSLESFNKNAKNDTFLGLKSVLETNNRE